MMWSQRDDTSPTWHRQCHSTTTPRTRRRRGQERSASIGGTSPQSTRKSLSLPCENENHRRSVVVLPGDQLQVSGGGKGGGLVLSPPPPRQPPPIPSQIIQLVILGDEQSGKTSLVKQFLYRQNLHHQDEQQQSDTKPPTETTGAWSVDYYRKDITYWCKNDAFTCTRVQLWDVSGLEPFRESRSNTTELNQLIEKASGVVLVLSPQHGLQHVIEGIPKWMTWLKKISNATTSKSSSCCLPHVTLFVHKHDLLHERKEQASTLIRFGSSISEACRQYRVSAWHVTSCTGDAVGVEAAFMDITKELTGPET